MYEVDVDVTQVPDVELIGQLFLRLLALRGVLTLAPLCLLGSLDMPLILLIVVEFNLEV